MRGVLGLSRKSYKTFMYNVESPPWNVRDFPCIPLMLGTLAMNMAMKFATRRELVIFRR